MSNEAIRILEGRILPHVNKFQDKERSTWPYETSTSNEDILQEAIAFLHGENTHLSGFIAISKMRWQGADFVIWLKEISDEKPHKPATLIFL